jgi:hypothetical protein
MNLYLASTPSGDLGVQTDRAWQWAFVAIALVPALAALAWAYTSGEGTNPVRRLLAGATRLSALPAWAAVGIYVGLWSLAVAFFGFVWDVAWHADTGRDQVLLTVPHTMILIGLNGIAGGALLTVITASIEQSEVGWRIGRIRIPYGALPMGLFGLGALLGFPLDDYWHATYGIDITMWSPTHLLMIGGASLTPIALWLLLGEAGAGDKGPARQLWLRMGGVVLIGLSTFQLEYDIGVEQWQLLLQPVLIAAAAGFALVAARAAVGRGGALLAVGSFLVLRILVALAIGPGLHDSLPRFPVYIAEAVVVEAAFVLPWMGALSRAVVAGALVGTVGLAAEAAWIRVWYVHPWPGSLLSEAWPAPFVAIAAAAAGMALGRAVSRRRVEVPAVAVVAALALIAGVLVLHVSSRQVQPAAVRLQATQVGDQRVVTDRHGRPVVGRDVALALAVDPASSVAGSDFFDVVAWQGREPVRHIRLIEVAPGQFRAERPVPVGGTWKSLVLHERGDVVEAVPVAFPADPDYGLQAVEPPAEGVERFVPASSLLMRESHGAVIWPALLATTVFVVMIVAWVGAIALAGRSLASSAQRRVEQPGAVTRPTRELA